MPVANRRGRGHSAQRRGQDPQTRAARAAQPWRFRMSDDVVLLDVADKIATLTLNRPEKRNAMNPALNVRMLELLDELEGRDDVGVVVLTGAGESWSAGMDLKEYFRDNDDKPCSATLKT